MGHQVSVSEGRKYILVTVEGDVTARVAGEFVLESQAISADSGICRFLFDFRAARNIESVLGNYDYAYKDSAKVKLSRNTRSAILHEAGDESHEFVVTLFRNAGYNVRSFVDETGAIAWLEEA